MTRRVSVCFRQSENVHMAADLWLHSAEACISFKVGNPNPVVYQMFIDGLVDCIFYSMSLALGPVHL